MLQFSKWLLRSALLAGAVLVSTGSPARASIDLTLTEGSSTVSRSNPDSGGSVSYSGAVGSDFSVLIAYGDSNSPGGQTALTQAGSIVITNNSSSAATITITVSAQDFTSPVSPSLQVLDTVSGSVATGSLISGSAQGFADSSNALFGEGFASTLLQFGPNSSGTSFSVNGNVGGFNSGPKYSLTFTETFTLAGNSSLTLTGGNVQTALPEPTSLMAAFTAVPFLGLGAWLRRRKLVI